MAFTTDFALTEAVPTDAINNYSPLTDSPIQIVSIKPVARRGHRRMPMPPADPSLEPYDGDQVVHIGRFNVIPSKPEARSPKQPISDTNTPSAVHVKSLLQSSNEKSTNQPENLFTSKSLQGGAWLQVVPGKYPVYYAIARANGLFQEHSIRAYPAKRGFAFKH